MPREEIKTLDDLCHSAFARVQPLASLDEKRATRAVRNWLAKTETDGDGPLIEPACFLAFNDRRDQPVGAILVTLAHPGAATHPFGGEWKSPPPPDAVEKRLGVPHLTWILVSPWETRRGVGTALLSASCRALTALGFTQLASTFLLGHDASTLWHWKHGFRLIGWSEGRRPPVEVAEVAPGKPGAK